MSNQINDSANPYWESAQKFLAVLLFITLLPMHLILWLLVRLDSPGPYLYSQMRSGRNGQRIRVWKIRSMTVGADKNKANALNVGRNNPQVTRIGHYLRQLKIDETPQLINIIRGEMQFVGPRPIADGLLNELTPVIPGFLNRQQVKPGLTSFAQVTIEENLDDHIADWRRRFQAEWHYIHHQTPAYDIFVMLLTVRYLLKKVFRTMMKVLSAASSKVFTELTCQYRQYQWQRYMISVALLVLIGCHPKGYVKRPIIQNHELNKVQWADEFAVSQTDYTHLPAVHDRHSAGYYDISPPGSYPGTHPGTHPGNHPVNHPGLASSETKNDQMIQRESLVADPMVADKQDLIASYKVGPGDMLAINVFGEPGMSDLKVRVDGKGLIQLPFIEAMNVNDMTTETIQQKLRAAYNEHMKEPWVTVQVYSYRSQPIYLLGDFKEPGVLYLEKPTRIIQALSMGKGLTPNANLRQAVVLRDKKILPVDIYRLLREGAIEQNIVLQPEDTIYVPDKQDQRVFVLGQVTRPGHQMMVHGQMSLIEAITMAGGPEFGIARLKCVHVIRSLSPTRGEHYLIDLRKTKHGRVMPFHLQAGDIVYVPRNPLEKWNEVIRAITPTLQLANQSVSPFINVKFLTEAF